MNTIEVEQLKSLTTNQMVLYTSLRKKSWCFIMLALLGGGIGLQWLYTGNYIYFLISLLFCWTFIPWILSLLTLLIELSAGSIINKQNEQIFNNIKNMKI